MEVCFLQKKEDSKWQFWSWIEIGLRSGSGSFMDGASHHENYAWAMHESGI